MDLPDYSVRGLVVAGEVLGLFWYRTCQWRSLGLTGKPRHPLGYLSARVGYLVSRPIFAGLLVVIAFPPALASFWNIPTFVPWKVDIGLKSQVAYEESAIPSAPATLALDRLARSGFVVIGDAYA